MILGQAKVIKEEFKDPTTWKVDISETYEPDIKAFDHHLEGISDCSFSLLSKYRGKWERANVVYSWILFSLLGEKYTLTLMVKIEKKNKKYLKIV